MCHPYRRRLKGSTVRSSKNYLQPQRRRLAGDPGGGNERPWSAKGFAEFGPHGRLRISVPSGLAARRTGYNSSEDRENVEQQTGEGPLSETVDQSTDAVLQTNRIKVDLQSSILLPLRPPLPPR
jgi:hypothetical protein